MKLDSLRQTVMLVDGNNMLWRGHHATPPLTSVSGEPTNAILGMFNILLSDIKAIGPTHLVVFWDLGGKPSWRKEIYPDYKKKDPSKMTPEKKEDMRCMFAQAELIQDILRSIGIRMSGKAGEEADDLIGTVATKFAAEGAESIIVSSDKDYAQLVGNGVWMFDGKIKKRMGVKEIVAKFGVPPEKIVEYLALLGDTADNIPGVNKVGAVTAAKLLNEHGSIKGIYKNLDSLTPKLRENLLAAKGQFKLTKQLLTIKTDIPVKTCLDNCRLPVKAYDSAALHNLLLDLNLHKARSGLNNVLGLGLPHVKVSSKR